MKTSLKYLKNKIVVLTIILFSSFTFSQSQPYVILISFDAFRWDYVDRDESPNIDTLIQKGVKAISFQPVFPSKTFPNHLSIITGMYPEHHGIIFNDFRNPFDNRYFKISDTVEVRESEWYRGEAFWETAKRQGIITASYFWPGSDIDLGYRQPDYYYKYKHSRPYKDRIKGVIDWLELPYNKRPHFITMYFELTDDVGHRKGPDSPEINWAIASLDSTLGNLLSDLNNIGMRDSINIILVSDHGMTKVSTDKVINVEEMLNGYTCEYSNSGPVMMVSPVKEDLEKVYSILSKNENHYKVYKKNNVPSYYHFSQNPMILDILLVADLGWSLITSSSLKWMKSESFNGNHGYDNHQMDMQGIFIAEGPVFKNHYKTGTINCLDVYPLLCKIFNVVPNSNIDGQLDRIEFILKEDHPN